MMNSEFERHFCWVREMINQNLDSEYHGEPLDYEILQTMKSTWTADHGLEMLKELDENYGDAAKHAVTEFMKPNLQRDWAAIGKNEAHEGTEIEDFIRVLWEPLKKSGFEFDRKNNGSITQFTVTRCPVFEFAEKTGMHEWFYHMSCMTDFFTTPSFSDKIGFIRTKSLMQGDEYCNHSYYYKDSIADDMRLG